LLFIHLKPFSVPSKIRGFLKNCYNIKIVDSLHDDSRLLQKPYRERVGFRMVTMGSSWPSAQQWGKQFQHWLQGQEKKPFASVDSPRPAHTARPTKDALLSFVPQAENLDQVWEFIQPWLAHAQLGLLWLTTVADYTLSIRYSWPQLAEPVHINTRQTTPHHLEQCCLSGDTTFCYGTASLGGYVTHLLPEQAPVQYFSIPLKVAGTTQAIITLGFHQVSPETQRLVSKVYNHKELLGQLTAQCLLRESDGKAAYLSASPQQQDAKTLSQSLMGALAAKDAYTAGHSFAAAEYVQQLASWIGLPDAEIWPVRLAGLLHDIGKIGIPDAILHKPGPLTPDEWEIMQAHPVIGAEQILAPISAMRPVVPLVLHHHEHWDGSGYPYGLSGDAIPLGARIVAIADAYHGLTSARRYRGALSRAETLTLMEKDAGTLWDPALLAAFSQLVQSQPG
jgi:HD-GYP domain-containing protein (c-di-GMP phosphodiesterase class II)